MSNLYTSMVFVVSSFQMREKKDQEIDIVYLHNTTEPFLSITHCDISDCRYNSLPVAKRKN